MRPLQREKLKIIEWESPSPDYYPCHFGKPNIMPSSHKIDIDFTLRRVFGKKSFRYAFWRTPFVSNTINIC